MNKATKDKTLWTNYKVTWKFPGNLFGSVPKDVEIIKPWLKARRPDARPPNSKSIEEVQTEVVSTLLEAPTIAEEVKRISLGFQYINGSIVVRGATIRAHLKDCGRVVGQMFVGKIKGEYSLGWKITNGLYVNEYFVNIRRPDGTMLSQPDGAKDLMVHAQGPTGPINALKRVDFVTGVQIEFAIKLLSGLRVSDLETVMAYGSVHGYAGERSMGEGRYVYSIEESS